MWSSGNFIIKQRCQTFTVLTPHILFAIFFGYFDTEDIELGCDEAVVQHMDGAGRRDYAELLLRTAGDGRGFTSCLSASARSMRCRMRCVMNPVRKWDGCLLPALTTFLLVVSYGLLSFVPG